MCVCARTGFAYIRSAWARVMSHISSSSSMLSDTASPTCTLSNRARTCDTYTLDASGAHGTAHLQPQEAHQGERALHAHQACGQRARDYTHREGCEYMDDLQACNSLRAVGLVSRSLYLSLLLALSLSRARALSRSLSLTRSFSFTLFLSPSPFASLYLCIRVCVSICYGS